MSKETSASNTAPSIAIIGGGVGGLTLAAVLARDPKFSANVTVYERDVGPSARAHLGGSLDLHHGSGLAAIKACGLEDEFARKSRPEGDSAIITNKTGVPIFEEKPKTNKKSTRPEIDRTVLRNMLLDAIPNEWIKWDHALVSTTKVGDSSSHQLVFANGFTTTCTLLVGADGARSRVRPLVSDAQLSYTGITGVEISLAPGAPPEIVQRVGEGMMLAFDSPGKAFMSQMNGDGRIRTYALVKHSDPHFFTSHIAVESGGLTSDTLSEEEVGGMLTQLEETYSDWAPWMREIIARSDRSAVYPRALYVLPADHSWTHKPGVTLVGDAANLMSPFAGEGANVAMRAGMELGATLLALSSHSGAEHWDEGVKEYERRRVKYASAAARESAQHLEEAFSEGAAETFAALFRAHSSILGMAVFALGAARKWFFG